MSYDTELGDVLSCAGNRKNNCDDDLTLMVSVLVLTSVINAVVFRKEGEARLF